MLQKARVWKLLSTVISKAVGCSRAEQTNTGIVKAASLTSHSIVRSTVEYKMMKTLQHNHSMCSIQYVTAL